MTGTPVLNRPGELWPILNMISPETFPSEETFIKQYTYDKKTARNVEELKEVLKPIMIRRKQSDVVDELPPLNRIEEYHELSKKAMKLYQKILEGIYDLLMEAEVNRYAYEGQEKLVINVLAKIMYLKRVCAIDKVERTADLATEIHESASEDKHNKVLIFSQFKAVAFAIHQRLGHESLCFVSPGGADGFTTADVNERDRIVQQFQNDSAYKYLVVTEKSAKEGHNITEAGHVIFNDLFWTPAAHDQGEGRAYMRINDPHGIDSYYLITDMNGDSIEEWIWQLLALKTDVINQTVEGVEASRDVSVASELIQKLKDSMYTRRK
jgi:SNF2 family DNA or RNA helicase